MLLDVGWSGCGSPLIYRLVGVRQRLPLPSLMRPLLPQGGVGSRSLHQCAMRTELPRGSAAAGTNFTLWHWEPPSIARAPRSRTPGAAEVTDEQREQLANFAQDREGEDVVEFGLLHQLAQVVRTDLRIGTCEPDAESVGRQIVVPQEVRPTFASTIRLGDVGARTDTGRL